MHTGDAGRSLTCGDEKFHYYSVIFFLGFYPMEIQSMLPRCDSDLGLPAKTKPALLLRLLLRSGGLI